MYISKKYLNENVSTPRKVPITNIRKKVLANIRRKKIKQKLENPIDKVIKYHSTK